MNLRRQLLLRLDDACPSMVHEHWLAIEQALDTIGVKPIVGVIPECRDPTLFLREPDLDFWARVRGWQQKGWTIAMHGLHHIYHDDPPGTMALVNFHRRGEFVGLDIDMQRLMFRSAWAICVRNGVRPTMFMAPSHSFDATTLAAMRQETPIRWITDGVSFRPFFHEGVHWLPQQLGRLPNWIPPGAWTACLHPNSMTTEQVERTVQLISHHRAKFVTVEQCKQSVRRRGLPDRVFEKAYWTLRWVRSNFRQAVH